MICSRTTSVRVNRAVKGKKARMALRGPKSTASMVVNTTRRWEVQMGRKKQAEGEAGVLD